MFRLKASIALVGLFCLSAPSVLQADLLASACEDLASGKTSASLAFETGKLDSSIDSQTKVSVSGFNAELIEKVKESYDDLTVLPLGFELIRRDKVSVDGKPLKTDRILKYDYALFPNACLRLVADFERRFTEQAKQVYAEESGR